MSPLPAPARVVFADDEPGIRDMLRRHLGALAHVTVVGEATDGVEAVELAALHYPDTVLLDIAMPRLNGFAAAEVIRSFRPQTELILHTADLTEDRRSRAARLGVPLLDKLDLSATMATVETSAIAAEHAPAFDIDPLILMALAGRTNEGILVVRVDHTVPFYNPAFASVLDLPFPPETVTLADLHGRGLARRADGTAVPLEEQPILRAMTAGQTVTGGVFLRVPEGELRPYTMSSVPFFGVNGELIGVANYVTEATAPGQTLAADDPLLESRRARLSGDLPG